MDIEKKRSFIINVLYYGLIAIIAYFVFKYAMAWLFPFILAFLIVALLQMIIQPLKRVMHAKNERIAIIILLLLYILIGAGISLLVFKLVIIIGENLKNLPQIIEVYIEPTVTTLFNDMESLVGSLSPQLLEMLKDAESNFMEIVVAFGSVISSSSMKFISGFIASIPNFLLSALVTIISSFFIAIDFHHINQFILAQCTPKVKGLLYEIKDYAVNTLLQIIFAYAKLMTITFVELSVGFMILGVGSPFLIALLISIFDVLPVLGTGGIMIPWVIYLFINNEMTLAVGMLILYIVITVIRNIIEPKIVGKQVGIHPLLMLVSMFAGAKVFGVLGLLICPIVIIIIMNLNDTGKIHLYRNIDDEPDPSS